MYTSYKYMHISCICIFSKYIYVYIHIYIYIYIYIYAYIYIYIYMSLTESLLLRSSVSISESFCLLLCLRVSPSFFSLRLVSPPFAHSLSQKTYKYVCLCPSFSVSRSLVFCWKVKGKKIAGLCLFYSVLQARICNCLLCGSPFSLFPSLFPHFPLNKSFGFCFRFFFMRLGVLVSHALFV